MKKEEVNKKIFYTISEVADLFDVNQSQLRSWEKQFPTLKPHRNRKGNRLFTSEDIETLKVIYNLVKVRGVRVSSAVKEIDMSGSQLIRNSQVTDKLLNIRSQLRVVLEQISDSNENKKVVYTNDNE